MNVQNHRRAACVALLLPLLAFAGCESPPVHSDTGVTSEQFKDLPVPAGMRLQEQFHGSDSRQIGAYRYANLRYSGGVPIKTVEEYLLSRMPQHSWDLVANEAIAEGGRRMEFRRGNYVAECVLTAGKSSTTDMHMKVRTTVQDK